MRSVFHSTQVNRKYVTLTSLVPPAFVFALCSTAAFAAPTFVQRNYATPKPATAAVTVSYSATETAADLKVVVVG